MILRASAAHIWTKCPGSTRLPKTEYESDAATSGTRIHEYVHKVLTNKTLPEISKEEKALGDEAVDYVRRLFTKNFTLKSEQQVQGIHISDDVGGTCDCVLSCDSPNGIREYHIIDFKFGFGSVEAVDNKQLLVYAAGLVLLSNSEKVIVHLHIFQPRDFINGKAKVWTLCTDKFKAEMNLLKHSVHTAKNSTELKTGNHCRYCSSRLHCPAFFKDVQDLTDTVMLAPDGPVELSEKALGAELTYIREMEKKVKYAKNALEELAERKLKNGESVPGWYMRKGRSRRYWDADISKLKELEKKYDIELVTQKPVSITAAMRHKEAREDISKLLKMSSGALTLAPDDGAEAKEVFENE